MTHRSQVPLALMLCALASAPAIVSLRPATGEVRTEDRNRDGRPDVWRVYDRQHQISEVAVDTNFDGRSDVREYYDRGALVRREADRNFDNRVDLIEEFDSTTREHVRSVVDVDHDGTADLLVLFQGGQPVFSKWAHPAAVTTGASALPVDASSRTADDPLAPLEDPFRTDLALSAVRVPASPGDHVGVSAPGGFPAFCHDLIGALASLSDKSCSSFSRPSSATIVPYSPRGPPISPLLA